MDATCPGCDKPIDPEDGKVIADQHGRVWHSYCRVHAVEQREGNPRPAKSELSRKLMWSVVVPLWGLIYGVIRAVIYFTRNETGPGLALLVASVAASVAWTGLFASISVQASQYVVVGTIAGATAANFLFWRRP